MYAMVEVTPKRRRLNNRSSEAAYAGPAHLVTPPGSHSPESVRSKRSDGSSSSSSSKTHQFTIEDFRITGPIYLPVPVQFLTSADDVYTEAWAAGLESEVYQILSSHNIKHAVANLYKRETRHTGAIIRSADYIFVETTKLQDVDDQWLNAAVAILELCHSKGFNDLNVEIAEERGLIPKITATIQPTLNIVSDWDVVLPGILEALKPNKEWLTIDLVSRAAGPVSRSAEQPLWVPTVLILIKETTDESFTAACDDIAALLNPRYPQVAVEIVRGTLHGSGTGNIDAVFRHHGEKLWQESAYMGASIQRTDPAAGVGPATFGCFLKLTGQEGSSRVCGLTNFHVAVNLHVAIETQDTQTQAWRRHGMPPGTHFNLSMPSKNDLEAAVTHYESRISEIHTNPDILRIRKKMREYESEGIDLKLVMSRRDLERERKHGTSTLPFYQDSLRGLESRRQHMNLGNVYAASGQRKNPKNMILDWALMEVMPSRTATENTIPVINGVAFDNQYLIGTAAHALDVEVFKIGRSSGETHGFVNRILTTKLWNYRMQGNTIIYEVGNALAVSRSPVYTIADRGSPFFSEEGDSGSVVFNKESQVVGLLFGGNSIDCISYIMPVDDMFQDIKNITGAVAVEVLEP